MDIWERSVRKALIYRSENAVQDLNRPYLRRGRDLEEIIRRTRAVQGQLRLAILLLKLNSKSHEAVEWASGLTRGFEDVA